MTEIIPLNECSLHSTINKMLLSFSAGERARAARVNIYAEALCRFPICYVREACDYVIRGKLNGGRFIPNAGEVVQLAEELQRRSVEARNQGNKPPKLIPIPWGERKPDDFDPKAKVFSPYRLGMTQDEIIAKLKEEGC